MDSPLLPIGISAGILVLLAALPPGRIALAGLGLGVAVVLGVLVWPDDGNLVSRLPVSATLALVVALATLVQLSRHMRRAAPMNTMLALVAILVILAGLVLSLLARL